jgi:hypothetical protein
MTLLDDTLVHLFQFSVEDFLGRFLRENINFLEHFEVEIVEKSEETSTVIISVGFVFYNEKQGKWSIGMNIIGIPVDGKPVKHLYQQIKCYDLRQGRIMENDLRELMAVFSRAETDCSVMSNESKTEYRVLPVPDLGVILIDERNGRISFS